MTAALVNARTSFLNYSLTAFSDLLGLAAQTGLPDRSASVALGHMMLQVLQLVNASDVARKRHAKLTSRARHVAAVLRRCG